MRNHALLRPLFVAALLAGCASARGRDTAPEVAESILGRVRRIPGVGPYRLEVEVGRGELRLFGSGRTASGLGEVKLTGYVPSEWVRREIESIARETPGVTGVKNLLEVRPGGRESRD